ncbi:MAG: SusC/RagA family TonB-linked outer membrane protein, partial [Duncaniella sp.]|nr:SusC/RagA family TonB-linked outer membrane protein [Duncaniella sp.]
MINHQKHFIALCITLLLGLVSLPVAWADPISVVSGEVTDQEEEPIIGATVREAGTLNATATDIDGKYTLKLLSANAKIEISYIGYKTVTLPVNSSHINVVLESTTTDLDEVVVVAYGQQKKVTVTGSVAAVGAAEIKKSSEPNLAATLAGKLPGLTAMQQSGAPGEDDVKMFLRGAATTNGTSPLILVDGIPRSSMSEIDPNEVQSISVLKDASSTAVFGVRGANGVILITTRRGEEGKINVHGQVTYSMQKFNYWPESRHSYEFARMANEAALNDGAVPEYSDEQIALYDLWKTGGSSDPAIRYWYPDTDWGKVYLKDHSNMVQANVNITGGSKKLKYFASAGYVYQGGMYKTESKDALGYDPQSKMNRYNIRTNLDYKFNNWISASLDVSSFIKKTNQAAANMAGANTAGLRWAALTSKPTVP